MDKDFKMLLDEIKKQQEISRIQALASKSFLSVDETCDFFSFKKGTLYKLTSQRKIPFYKRREGKLIRFRRKEIERWIEKGRVKTIFEIEKEVAYGKN